MTGPKPKGAGRPVRERDRYRRASLSEQLAEDVRGLAQHANGTFMASRAGDSGR